MRSKRPVVAVSLFVFLFPLVAVAAPMSHGEGAEMPSLYKRLGGYDAIAAVVDEFIGRLVADPELSRFFTGMSADSKARLRQLAVDQLCAATGGPCLYLGRDMKTAHQGAGITEKDWNRTVEHLVAAMDKYKVGAKEKAEVLGALSALKADVVQQ